MQTVHQQHRHRRLVVVARDHVRVGAVVEEQVQGLVHLRREQGRLSASKPPCRAQREGHDARARWDCLGWVPSKTTETRLKKVALPAKSSGAIKTCISSRTSALGFLCLSLGSQWNMCYAFCKGISSSITCVTVMARGGSTFVRCGPFVGLFSHPLVFFERAGQGGGATNSWKKCHVIFNLSEAKH